jgi:tetratricopeptide (TPR) repeat protein
MRLALDEAAAEMVPAGRRSLPSGGVRISGRVSAATLAEGARRFLRRLRPSQTGTDPLTVAVLPFAVGGSERLAYLREGMVDLLSTRLDGAGELRAADPRAVLALAARDDIRPIDPARARLTAERVGAGLFVLGSLVEIGGRLQLGATLYDASGTLRTTANVVAHEEGDLFRVVDQLAIQLLAGEAGSASGSGGTTSLAAATTHSLDALRAYLEGERHLRAGRFGASRDCFRRAVDADPAFALAWYRLSVAAEWTIDRELQDQAAEHALEHADRLPERDRELLEAFVAWRRGSRAAEGLYRELLGRRPDDVEAWWQLGEVIFHYGPLRGRSILASREAWERVLDIEPAHLPALHHLQRIAAVEGEIGEVERITSRILAQSPDSERALEARALRDAVLRDADDARRTLAELRRAADSTVHGAARAVAVYAGDPGAAVEIARLLAAPTRADEIRALAHLQIAYLESARGRRQAAREELAAAARLAPNAALLTEGVLATLPLSRSTPDELAELRERLERWEAAAAPPSASRTIFVRAHDGAHDVAREWLLAAVALRLGDGDAARRHADALALRGRGRTVRRLAAALSQDACALITAARGEGTAALEHLERIVLEVGYDLPLASPLYSRPAQRWVRAELLAAAGRGDEARRWWEALPHLSVHDLVLAAPAHLRAGALAEQAGDRRAAADHAARAAALWRDCDPELRAHRLEAEARLTRTAEHPVPRAADDVPLVPPMA